MSSELEVLRQRINDLEAENVELKAVNVEIAELRKENAELRKENTVIPDLRNKLSVYDAEIAELKRRNAETLRMNEEYNERRDAENAELKAEVEELKKNKEDSSAENVRRDVEIAEIKAEIVKLAEGAQVKDNNEENKELTQDISPEGVDNVHNSISDQCDNATSCVSDQKSSEDREMDTFLNEARKKSVSDRIRHRNKEKKLNKASFNQDQESVLKGPSDTGLTADNCASSDTSTSEISAEGPRKNSHRKKGAENIVQLIADGIKDGVQSSDKAIPCDEISVLRVSTQNSSTDSLLSLAQLFDKADDAEDGAIRANQEEILRWYYYGKEFLTQVSVIVQDGKGKIGEKKAKGIIYDKILEHLSMLRKQRSEETGLRLPEISRKNLQRKTQKAVKIYEIFEKLGVENIKYITTYSANSISELTNDKVQDIIDNFSEHNDQNGNNDSTDVEEVSSHMAEISAGGPGQNSVEVSELITPIPLSHDSAEGAKGNSSGDSSKIGPVAVSTSSAPQVISSNRSGLPVSILPEDPEEKRQHIIGQVLEKFPYLSLDDSDERRDTFNLDSSAFCPLCNGDHKVNRSIFDEIKGEWGAGEYYGERTYRIKCKDPLNRGTPIVAVKA